MSALADHNAAARALARLEALFSRAFGGAANPFHHLGALTVYFFWIALVTGIYLFVFYETSLAGAWASTERLTVEQWYLGGVMRSLHRYASDGAVLCMMLHLLRELVRVRFQSARWFSWVSGMPLIWIVIVFGISGYWMVWDQLAQYIAVSTARLLDWLPIFTDPMSRNFLDDSSVSDRFFTLIAFIHLVGLPIILVLAIWFHLLRVRLPKINPPRLLMAGSLAAMLLLSLVLPALSHPPADLGQVPARLAIDWFYLAVYPLLDWTSEAAVWSLMTGGTLALTLLPFVFRGRRPSVAEVHLPDCTGCGFCAEDCPYGAIDMVPRTDQRHFTYEPKVDPDLCTGCGICTGSCPSSSPLRRQQPLLTGIALPDFDMERLKQRVTRIDDAQPGPRLLVIGCDHAVDVEALAGPADTRVSLPCSGMLPPAVIDHALRATGFDGVVVSGCDACDCYHRHGDRWTRERVARERRPSLRERVPRDRLMLSWLKPTERRRLENAIEAFRGQLPSLPLPGRLGQWPAAERRIAGAVHAGGIQADRQQADRQQADRQQADRQQADGQRADGEQE
jgi:quinol-cytochrome oxidoreductase complex cytochrome b subunit/coenzyme F420-reducing hydrogenase delta subunit